MHCWFWCSSGLHSRTYCSSATCYWSSWWWYLWYCYLSMLVVLHSTMNVTRLLIWGNSSSWLLNSDLRDTEDGGIKCFLNFNARKTQLVSFDPLNNSGAIDEKMLRSALELFFFSKLNWGSYIASIAKTCSKKIRTLICSMKFLSSEVTLFLYNVSI